MEKTNIKLSIIILLLIVSSLSATYAWLELSTTANTTESQAGCFVVNYSGTVSVSSSIESINDFDDSAVQPTNITLSKNAECKIYTQASIYLYTNASSTAPLCGDEVDTNGDDTISETEEAAACSMKYQVMQGTTTVSSGTISTASRETTGQLLATVSLTETATTYKIYIWIDSTDSKGIYNGKTFSGYLYASSTQTSTIK